MFIAQPSVCTVGDMAKTKGSGDGPLAGVAAVLQRRRLELQLSQADVAERMGTAPSKVSKYETGGGLQVDTFNTWCSALGIESLRELQDVALNQGGDIGQTLAWIRDELQVNNERLKAENTHLLEEIKDLGDTADSLIAEIFHEMEVKSGDERKAITERAVLRLRAKRETAELEKQRQEERPRGIRAAFKFSRK